MRMNKKMVTAAVLGLAFSFGAARKINKNNSFYMDIEKDFGNKVKKPYAIGAGYRYTF